MNTLIELEKEAMQLPAQEREQFVLAVWDSLEASDSFDPEGIRIAKARDKDIEEGLVQPISHAEFRRLTGGVE